MGAGPPELHSTGIICSQLPIRYPILMPHPRVSTNRFYMSAIDMHYHQLITFSTGICCRH